MPTKHYCGTCAAFDEANGGECHARPPRAQVIMMPQKTLQGVVSAPVPVTFFPKVEKNHWCLSHSSPANISFPTLQN